MFEKAKWISNQKEFRIVGNSAFNERSIHGSFLFRKNIKLGEKVKSAVISVCGLGYGVFYINGKRVTDDVLTTPFTRYDKTVIYQQYDVTELVCIGVNTLGAYVGNGWYNDVAEVWDFEKAPWRDSPKMIAQLDVITESGEKLSFVSNKTWKFSDGPCVYNHIREGEIYDARLEQPGWNESDFNDSSWENVSVCRHPGGILKTTDMPPERVIREIKPKYLGNDIYDFGENISGWVHMKVSGKSGTEVSVRYSERYENGDIDTEQIDLYLRNELKNCDKYIMSGKGVEEYEPTFCYHGFRYIKVDGAFDNIELTAKVVHTDLQIVGDFECSDEMLNKIHAATRRSTLTNYHGMPTDCPHREQNGWTGDALVSAEQAIMNYDMNAAYKKWINDFTDAQRLTGQLPGIIPSSGWGYNRHGGPAWDSALILIPYYVFKYTGDKSVLCQAWNTMKLYIDYLCYIADDYIIDYGYGDWCPPEDAVICPRSITDTACFYVDALTMARCSEVLGENSEKYTELAKCVKKAYRDKFIIGTNELDNCQTFLACSIYQGLYNDDEKPEAARKLAELVRSNNYHIDCGMLGTKYIFSALSEYGYADVLYKMVTNDTMPGYAYWINSGMTTLCEHWNMSMSLNHHAFSEVDMWFYKHIAGIQINEDNITIKPCFIKNLKWVKAQHKNISVHWTKDELFVSVPKPATVIVGEITYSVQGGEHRFTLGVESIC